LSNFQRVNWPALLSLHKDVTLYDKELMKSINDQHYNLEAILNRGIKFQDNVDCVLVTFTSSATPDAENTVAHTLGKVPTGYLTYGLNKGAVVYTGTTTWTTGNIYLKVNVASTVVKLIIF